MEKNPLDSLEREHCVDFEHVILATIYMFMSHALDKAAIPEGAAACLRIFENPAYIVGQFLPEPSPVVQELMPSKKPRAEANPAHETIKRGKPMR